MFSKRAGQVEAALAAKVEEFRHREGRDPTRRERAALSREASADTRAHKSGHGVSDLRSRWAAEAGELGWRPDQLVAAIDAAGQDRAAEPIVSVDEVLDHLSASGSTWTRADVLRAICDRQPAVSSMDGHRWATTLERAADRVIERCVDLDPPDTGATRRSSDGRSVWVEPVAPHFTSESILAEEEHVLAWAMQAQADDAAASSTVTRAGLDVLQADAAAAVAGADRLVVVVGPAGTGKTTMLERAVEDVEGLGSGGVRRRPHGQGRPRAGTGDRHEGGHGRQTAPRMEPHRSAAARWYRLEAGTTVIVDEAGMVGTSSLHHLVRLAEREGWRLVMVGDPHQLQAVGRGGLFAELCATSRVHELARIHRFTNRGRRRHRCSCEPGTRPRSTPTRTTGASSPAGSTTTSMPSPRRGSGTCWMVTPWRSPPPPTTTSTPSTTPSSACASPSATSTPTLWRRSLMAGSLT